MKKRLLSLFCAAALLAGLLPTTAFALDGDKAIMLGTSGIKDPTAEGRTYYAPSSYVYFGVNSENSSTPIKWRVLDADKTNDGKTRGMFLLSEYLLTNGVKFNENDLDGNQWQGSDAQKWCTAFASNSSNFSTAEQSAMQGIAKEDSSETLYSVSWGASSLTEQDKMFFLSARELTDYVGNYDGAPGLSATDTAQIAGFWWLRSPDAYYTYRAGLVYSFGYVNGSSVDYDWAARPAFNLNLNSVLFTSAAVGGKIPAASSGGNQGSVGADAIFEIGAYTGNEWKLTLLDNSRNFAVTEDNASGNPGDTITLNYTGATVYNADTAPNEYISVIIADDSGAQYYGRITQPTSAEGQVEITIPTSLVDGTYTLNVFSEQYNGGANDDTKLTDYASAFETVSLTVSNDTTAPTLSNGSATRDSDTTATVKFTSSEAGTCYYIAQDTEITLTKEQIAAQDTKQACSAGENEIKLDNISASAQYVAVVAQDAVGNISDTLNLTIPAYSSGGSSGGSTSSKTPSQQAADKIESAKDGETVEITLKSGKTTLDKEVFETLAGRDVMLEINLPGGISWTVNGLDIPADANLTDLDMGVSMGTSTIPVDVFNAITGEMSTIQISLKHNGEFGFTLTLTAPLGKEYADLWANLYHYDAGALKFEAAARIAADGTVSLPFTHASEYAIIIDDRDRTPKAFPFADVAESDWFYDAVDYAYQNELMNGTSAATFAPNGTMTRAMLVTILHRQAGEPVVNYAIPFTDVESGTWYTEAVRWAAAEGIVTGTSATTFAPDAPVTREQFATILYRYAQQSGADVSVGEDTNILSYADALEISEYAIPAMQWACGAGVIEGSGANLNPQSSATRAEAAAMLMRFCGKSSAA